MVANAPKSEVVQAWLEKDVKKKGQHILQDLVFDASAATNMSYHQIILQGGLPFSVKLTEKVDDEMRRDYPSWCVMMINCRLVCIYNTKGVDEPNGQSTTFFAVNFRTFYFLKMARTISFEIQVKRLTILQLSI